jgi:hypothetical protein
MSKRVDTFPTQKLTLDLTVSHHQGYSSSQPPKTPSACHPLPHPAPHRPRTRSRRLNRPSQPPGAPANPGARPPGLRTGRGWPGRGAGMMPSVSRAYREGGSWCIVACTVSRGGGSSMWRSGRGGGRQQPARSASGDSLSAVLDDGAPRNSLVLTLMTDSVAPIANPLSYSDKGLFSCRRLSVQGRIKSFWATQFVLRATIRLT